MGVYNGMGKPLFQAGQFGQPMVQNPKHNVVISQTGQIVPRHGLSQQLNVSAQQQAYAQQILSANHIQSLQNAINQMTGITNQARGFNGAWMYDSWQDSKYTKAECEFAIGQDAVTNLDDNIKIYDVTPVHIIISWGDQQSSVHPERIISIPFIDKLRQTKLYKMVK